MIARAFERWSDMARVEVSDCAAWVAVPSAGKPGRVAPAVAVAVLLAERAAWQATGDFELAELPNVIIE